MFSEQEEFSSIDEYYVLLERAFFMQLFNRKKNIIILVITIILSIAVFSHYMPKPALQMKNSVVISPTNVQTQTVIYKGVEGKDALTLLRSKVPVVLDHSGMVISINNVKADTERHQYWEFFINGKSSDVGSRQYVTKNGDTLMWELSTY